VSGDIHRHLSRWVGLPNAIQKKVKSGKISVDMANAMYDKQSRTYTTKHGTRATMNTAKISKRLVKWA